MDQVQQLHPEEGREEETPGLISYPASHYPHYHYIFMEQRIQTYDTPPPNYKAADHATHGFSHTPSAAQITAYTIIALSVAVYFSCTLPLYSSAGLLVAYGVFGVGMVVCAGLATLSNPTDRVVYYYKWSRYDRKVQFAPEYEKVLFCEFCDSYCWASSKHCRTCNRCVDNFDHHCMWFNNCVGDRNYWYFFASLLATLAYAVTLVIHVALASFAANLTSPPNITRLVLSWIVALTLAIFAFLLLNLILLHLYLMATNQTTYTFLQRKKKEEEVERLEREKDREVREKAEREAREGLKEASSENVLALKREGSKVTNIMEINSEESVANTKLVLVHNEKPSDDENIKTQRRRSRRKVSNDYFEEQLAKHSKKDDEENTVKSNQEQNQATVQEEPNEPSLEESRQKLPEFFRKNRSLRLLLSSSNAESPSKKKLEPGSQVLN